MFSIFKAKVMGQPFKHDFTYMWIAVRVKIWSCSENILNEGSRWLKSVTWRLENPFVLTISIPHLLHLECSFSTIRHYLFIYFRFPYARYNYTAFFYSIITWVRTGGGWDLLFPPALTCTFTVKSREAGKRQVSATDAL